MQLSDKSCELAEENDRLFDKNKEQRRRIELLETEQSELVKQNSIQHLIPEGMVRWKVLKISGYFLAKKKKKTEKKIENAFVNPRYFFL
jgi:hypothetical protein